jgi:hypothetical protein
MYQQWISQVETNLHTKGIHSEIIHMASPIYPIPLENDPLGVFAFGYKKPNIYANIGPESESDPLAPQPVNQSNCTYTIAIGHSMGGTAALLHAMGIGRGSSRDVPVACVLLNSHFNRYMSMPYFPIYPHNVPQPTLTLLADHDAALPLDRALVDFTEHPQWLRTWMWLCHVPRRIREPAPPRHRFQVFPGDHTSFFQTPEGIQSTANSTAEFITSVLSHCSSKSSSNLTCADYTTAESRKANGIDNNPHTQTDQYPALTRLEIERMIVEEVAMQTNTRYFSSHEFHRFLWHKPKRDGYNAFWTNGDGKYYWKTCGIKARRVLSRAMYKRFGIRPRFSELSMPITLLPEGIWDVYPTYLWNLGGALLPAQMTMWFLSDPITQWKLLTSFETEKMRIAGTPEIPGDADIHNKRTTEELEIEIYSVPITDETTYYTFSVNPLPRP